MYRFGIPSFGHIEFGVAYSAGDVQRQMCLCLWGEIRGIKRGSGRVNAINFLSLHEQKKMKHFSELM
jgi:hypothetical protein